MVASSKPSQIPGIDYDAGFVQSLYSTPGALAGVFGLPTTKELWALILHDTATTPIVHGWVEERKNFGCNVFGKIRQPALQQLLADPAMHSVLTSDQHPAFSSMGRNLSRADIPTLAKITGLWYLVRLVKAKPGLFPRSQVVPLLTINAYDLLHGWKFLIWIWREAGKNTLLNHQGRKCSQALRPVFYIPSLTSIAMAIPAPTAGVAVSVQNLVVQNAATVYTRDLTPNPIETPEEEEALNQAIVYGLGAETIPVEDTEPIFVEQDESEPEEDETDGHSEVAKEPISDEYIRNSDDEGYDSGYETADECGDIQAELRFRSEHAKDTVGQAVNGNADESATV